MISSQNNVQKNRTKRHAQVYDPDKDSEKNQSNLSSSSNLSIGTNLIVSQQRLHKLEIDSIQFGNLNR